MRDRLSKLIAIPVILLVALIIWQYNITQNAQLSGNQAFIEVPAIVGNAEPIQPIPLKINLNADKVSLGERLFFEKRLSASGNTSCATCHSMEKGAGDGLDFSIDDDGSVRGRNTLTVFNTGLQHIYNWDGRFTSLKAQAQAVLEHRMKTDWSVVLPEFRKEEQYRSAFEPVYKTGITPDTIADAIAIYQMSLITPNGRFDHYLRGDNGAITEEEKRGYKLFKRYGCVSCHQGVNVGGNMIATLGVMGDYFKDRGNETPADLGRYNVTLREIDKHRFKVPSLRNVALTAPYFHDASVDRLEDAIKTMAKYQLGQAMPDQDVDAIAKFLHTLTGELNGQALWHD